MPFVLSKLRNYRKLKSDNSSDLIDIKLPAEIAAEQKIENEFVIFVVEDNPHVMQALNTQLADIKLVERSRELNIIIKNFATGRSLLRQIDQNPDLVFINPDLNETVKNALHIREIFDGILENNSFQPIVVLGEYEEADNILAEPRLKNQILSHTGAEYQLNEILQSLVAE